MRPGKYVYIAIVVAGIGVSFFLAHREANKRGSTALLNAAERPLAPDFQLSTPDGQPISLKPFRGKVILLDFWATWCDACRDEIPRFIAMQDKYRDQGLQIIGVSMDDGPEPVRECTRSYKMNYPVAMGNAATGELYGGILGLPIAFVIDREGRICFKHTGAADGSVFEKEVVGLLHSQRSLD